MELNMTLDNLKKEVNSISKDSDVDKVVQQFGLVKEEMTGVPSQILSIHKGVIEGIKVSLRHRWYDPSGPFSIQPDVNKVELFINEDIVAVGSFVDAK